MSATDRITEIDRLSDEVYFTNHPIATSCFQTLNTLNTQENLHGGLPTVSNGVMSERDKSVSFVNSKPTAQTSLTKQFTSSSSALFRSFLSNASDSALETRIVVYTP